MPPDEPKPQGNQAPPGQGNGDEPKFVTEEQLNRAISARLGDFGKKIEKSIETAVSGIGAKLDEIAKREPSGGTPPPGGEGQKSIEESPIVKGLQKQLGEMQKNLDTAKADRDAEKQKTRDQSLRQRLQDTLTKGGLDPKFVRHAVGNLVDTEKLVRFADDESDDLVFRDGTTDVDLGTGIKTWLKSDDAKIYLPPRGTKGSGDQRDGKGSGNGLQPQPMTAGKALLGMALGTVAGGNANE